MLVQTTEQQKLLTTKIGTYCEVNFDENRNPPPPLPKKILHQHPTKLTTQPIHCSHGKRQRASGKRSRNAQRSSQPLQRNEETGFSNVYHIPELRHNLMSVAKLTDAGATVTFNKKTVRIDLQDKTFLVGHRGKDNLYRLSLKLDQVLLTQHAQH